MLRRSSRCLFLATLVLLVAAPAAGATFWGENGRISFNRFLEDQQAANIFTARPDGTGVANLTPFGFGVFSVFSDWSPDGRHLAIDTDRSGQAQVWILDADGSHARQLTDAVNGAFDPGWAPNGRTIAIEADFGDGAGIFLVPARPRHGALVTREHAQLVTRIVDGGYDSEPQVSPDGRWIAFTHYNVDCTAPETYENCKTQIFRVRTNGKRLQPLTQPALNASAPDWHPSGQRIAFDTHDNFPAPNVGHIMVMRPDGSGKQVIVRGDDDDFFNNPSFSPDGRQVTFARWPANGENPTPIWVASASGRGAHQLLDSPTEENKPDWGSAPKRGHHGH